MRQTIYQKLLKYRVVPVFYFLLLLAILGLGFYWFARTGLLPLIKDPDALAAYFQSLGFKAYLTVFLLQLFGVIFIPATGGIIVIASAMIFGFWRTFLICTCATVLGSCVSFAMARYLGRPLLELFLNKHKLDKYIGAFEERKNFLLFLMFFFPFFPDDILCYVAGLVNIQWRWFVPAAVLGRPWGLIINCIVGISVLSFPSWAYVSAALTVILAFALSWRYSSQWENRIIEKVNRRKKKRPSSETEI